MDDYARAESALTTIPSHDRETWVRIGMALKNGLGEEGFRLWDEWSATASNYDPKTIKQQWRSLKATGGTSFGTLFHLAAENGWEPPKNGDAGPRAQRPAPPPPPPDDSEERHAATAKKAKAILHDAVKRMATHPYLARKGFQDLKFPIDSHGNMVVPIKDADGVLHTLQLISPEGRKLFLKDGRKKACFFTWPRGEHANGDPLVVVEGLATGLSFSAATGTRVAVAFDAGNIPAVVSALQAKYPRSVVRAAPDGDAAGAAAASKSNADAIMPPAGKDWNDVHAEQGLTAVAKAAAAPAVLTLPPAGDNGKLPCNLQTAASLMAASFGTRLRFNTFTHEPEFDGHKITDFDVLFTTISIQAEIPGLKIGKETMGDAMHFVARSSPYDPVRTYLEAQKWDGTPRLDSWMAEFCGAEAGEWATYCGKFLFVAMVARAMEPGVKSDNMLILRGGQGKFKSSLLKTIGGKWFNESHDPVTSPNFRLGLRGKWLVELPELAAISRADARELKGIVSCQVDSIRVPYGRHHEDFPRTCMLVGTTNEDEVLIDQTGNRRFLPITVGCINLKGVAAIVDQLFAEALVLYRQGWDFWSLPPVAAEHQEAATERDDVLHESVGHVILAKGFPEKITAKDICDALLIPPERGMSVAKKLPKIMLDHGYRRTRSAKERFYTRIQGR